MDFQEVYLSQVSKYAASLKYKNLPLLSWDIHLQNISNITKFQEDLIYLKKFNSKVVVASDILKEYIENKAVLVITDLDFNIEFVSSNMVEMTGYQPREVIGNTPKMFQGPETDQKISKSIRDRVSKSEEFEYVIINYKKDNSLYKCQIKGYPVYDTKQNLIKYIAVEQVA